MSFESRRWDTRLGLDTDAGANLDDLVIDSENKKAGFAYVPSPPRLVATFLANLPRDLSDYVFVDFGSGKGRVLLLAAARNFKQIVGLEFSRELHETAEANVERFTKTVTGCRNIRPLHADVTRFDIPCGNSVLYFNNPFSEEVMAAVIRNIEKAHQQGQGTIYVLYQQLKNEPESDSTRNLEMLRAAPFLNEQNARCPTFLDALLLRPYLMRIFKSRDSDIPLTKQ